MAFVSTAALKMVLAVQIKNRPTAEPNYRPLIFKIICISSQMSDTQMRNKAMKIINNNKDES